MSDVVEKMASLRKLRNVALVAVLIPAALVAGCAPQHQAPPPPPPPPAPIAAPAPPPPPPPPVPVVRG